ncbi:dethiobiotin synthetase [Caulobacter ginsengisoli]|uniref:ATP-dependent dethiobiotin synthetase BioD n=1 Tax=Caulobacter ginsengisoli TaxID=400775 RepID=A0ABU0IQM8_9CAUL|nr:dethiobiotin synthase [Caulobacter ginsengisoli]MDQ0464322.1 dethiobiotin synthetase [Caulobacter ginsengisoli]
MPAIFITGTGTDVGKTYVTAALIRALRAGGLAVEASKPVVSGFDAARPAGSDPAVLLEALGLEATPEALNHLSPWQFAAPLSPPLAARLEGRPIDAEAVIAHCRARIAAAKGRLLIEGAGGVMSPLSDKTTMLDLAVALAAPTLLIAGSYLGTISHSLTALVTLRAAGGEPIGIVLSESLDAPPMDDTVAALEKLAGGVPIHVMDRNAPAPADLVDRLSRL